MINDTLKYIPETVLTGRRSLERNYLLGAVLYSKTS
jgi:hypothetical protein